MDTIQCRSAGFVTSFCAISFAGNKAVHSGGAFFLKCTEVFGNESTFTENLAQSNGGAMYVEEAHYVDFLNCAFEQNSAGTLQNAWHCLNLCDCGLPQEEAADLCMSRTRTTSWPQTLCSSTTVPGRIVMPLRR